MMLTRKPILRFKVWQFHFTTKFFKNQYIAKKYTFQTKNSLNFCIESCENYGQNLSLRTAVLHLIRQSRLTPVSPAGLGGASALPRCPPDTRTLIIGEGFVRQSVFFFVDCRADKIGSQ